MRPTKTKEEENVTPKSNHSSTSLFADRVSFVSFFQKTGFSDNLSALMHLIEINYLIW